MSRTTITSRRTNGRPDFDYAGAVADLDVYYDLGRDLANSREWPGWEAGSQFKPARDATAAERK